QNKNTECAVRFKLISRNDNKALEICEGAAPYYVISYKFGFPTECVYERPRIECGDEEAAIGDSCLIIKGDGTYEKSDEACGQYTLHQLGSETEKNWIS
ncbi:hypothetical protein GCK32_022152, partial [Trichostrongylus colubriformis]